MDLIGLSLVLRVSRRAKAMQAHDDPNAIALQKTDEGGVRETRENFDKRTGAYIQQLEKLGNELSDPQENIKEIYAYIKAKSGEDPMLDPNVNTMYDGKKKKK